MQSFLTAAKIRPFREPAKSSHYFFHQHPPFFLLYHRRFLLKYVKVENLSFAVKSPYLLHRIGARRVTPLPPAPPPRHHHPHRPSGRTPSSTAPPAAQSPPHHPFTATNPRPIAHPRPPRQPLSHPHQPPTFVYLYLHPSFCPISPISCTIFHPSNLHISPRNPTPPHNQHLTTPAEQ